MMHSPLSKEILESKILKCNDLRNMSECLSVCVRMCSCVIQCQSTVFHLKRIVPPRGCGCFSAILHFRVTFVSHRATVLHVFTTHCLFIWTAGPCGV